MAIVHYRAYFHWFINDVELSEGDFNSLTKRAEELLNRKFMEAYNKGANALNGHYEKWNKEFDALYGDEPDEDHKIYDRFISQKQNEVLKKIPDDIFELFTDPEFGECSICGRLKKKNVANNDVKVQITLKAIE